MALLLNYQITPYFRSKAKFTLKFIFKFTLCILKVNVCLTKTELGLAVVLGCISMGDVASGEAADKEIVETALWEQTGLLAKLRKITITRSTTRVLRDLHG